MSVSFISQDWGRPTYKHRKLPIYKTDEFNFYRCVEFKEDFYGKTASELFNNNLRMCTGRYSSLFQGQKISYWADSPQTARAEIKKHKSSKNIITFWAYDDVSSTFPCLGEQEILVIIDGRKCGIQELIDKADAGERLNEKEQIFLREIMKEKPDCLVYDSHARENGENYIFFEKGFRKLALRQLRLYLGEQRGKNHSYIMCAGTSDYVPFLECYGQYFRAKAGIGMNKEYLDSKEYKARKANLESSYEAYNDSVNKFI